MPLLQTLLMFYVFLLLLLHNFTQSTRALSRKKRYIVFQEGTTLSVSICLTFQCDITPGYIFTESLNWGLSYNLPNDTKEVRDNLKKAKQTLQRRHRRELYNKLERIMHSMGYDGRSCIKRALCEAPIYFGKQGDHLWDEVLRIIFRYPPGQEFWQNDDHDEYNLAATLGENCDQQFFCPFSLIDLAQGYYSIVDQLAENSSVY